MRKFHLSSDALTKHWDVYEEWTVEHRSGVFDHVRTDPALSFEEIAASVQRCHPYGHVPGRGEIAEGLIYLIQAGLVEAS